MPKYELSLCLFAPTTNKNRKKQDQQDGHNYMACPLTFSFLHCFVVLLLKYGRETELRKILAFIFYPDEEGNTGCTNFHRGTGFRCRVLVQEKGCCHTLTQVHAHTPYLECCKLHACWMGGPGCKHRYALFPNYKQNCKRCRFFTLLVGILQ